jgi:hypothetical protein
LFDGPFECFLAEKREGEPNPRPRRNGFGVEYGKPGRPSRQVIDPATRENAPSVRGVRDFPGAHAEHTRQVVELLPLEIDHTARFPEKRRVEQKSVGVGFSHGRIR